MLQLFSLLTKYLNNLNKNDIYYTRKLIKILWKPSVSIWSSIYQVLLHDNLLSIQCNVSIISWALISQKRHSYHDRNPSLLIWMRNLSPAMLFLEKCPLCNEFRDKAACMALMAWSGWPRCKESQHKEFTEDAKWQGNLMPLWNTLCIEFFMSRMSCDGANSLELEAYSQFSSTCGSNERIIWFSHPLNHK